jgi:HK97 family phage prohead protease
MDTPERAFERSVDFALTESDGQTLEGYAAVFDSPTVINSYEGHFVEVIERGAFARSVRNNPKPIMQFDHGKDTALGATPIGAIEELREDDKGLYVRARLHSNWLVEPIRDAIASGSIPGMSFKFTIPEGGVTVTRGDDGLETHTLTDLNLHELGPVVWPAYAETAVSVRASELANLLIEDEEARREVAAGLIFGTFPRKEEDETDLAVRSDEPSEEPTDNEEEPTAEDAVRSDDESVRPEDDSEPTATTTRGHRMRMAEIVAAKTDIYVLDALERADGS